MIFLGLVMLNIDYIDIKILLLWWEAEPTLKGVVMVYMADGANMTGSLLQMIQSQETKEVEETSREYQNFNLW